jgi:hypothetical protein
VHFGLARSFKRSHAVIHASIETPSVTSILQPCSERIEQGSRTVARLVTHVLRRAIRCCHNSHAHLKALLEDAFQRRSSECVCDRELVETEKAIFGMHYAGPHQFQCNLSPNGGIRQQLRV